jgi:hypothetical protein
MLKLMLKEQHTGIRNALAMAQARPPFRVQAKYLKILPAKINEYIAPFALGKVREQYELATHPKFARTTMYGQLYGNIWPILLPRNGGCP